MKYFVKTNFVPEDVDYLTPGKEYECDHIYAIVADQEHTLIGATITDDTGGSREIFIQSSAHLDGRPWEVIVRGEEEDEQ